MSETARPDCIYDLEGVASFLGWPHPNRYVYSLPTNVRTYVQMYQNIGYLSAFHHYKISFYMSDNTRPN